VLLRQHLLAIEVNDAVCIFVPDRNNAITTTSECVVTTTTSICHFPPASWAYQFLKFDRIDIIATYVQTSFHFIFQTIVIVQQGIEQIVVF
jgi:hypothetical protein|tara:strand:+ start:212 stop:484 length:273 start_codon:yes stop_codon:yes gene_type:complete